MPLSCGDGHLQPDRVIGLKPHIYPVSILAANPSGPLGQDRLPKSDIPAPRIGQYGPTQAHMVARQIADLRLLVGVAGFEPAASSSRTERSGEQNRCLTALPHVRAFG